MGQSQPDFGNLFVHTVRVCKASHDPTLLETGEATTQQGCKEAQDPSSPDREITQSIQNIVNTATAESITFDPCSVYIFELQRSIVDLRPPKLFFRTFWGSVARRIVEKERLKICKEQANATGSRRSCY